MPDTTTLPALSRGMHVFALTRSGNFIEAMVKEVLERDRARLFFPRVAGKKFEDATLSFCWIARPEENIAIVRMLWKEVEGGPLVFRIDRDVYPEFHQAAEDWPRDKALVERAENELFFGPVDTPVELRPELSLPAKSIALDLPRHPTRARNNGLAFRKRIQTTFGRF